METDYSVISNDLIVDAETLNRICNNLKALHLTPFDELSRKEQEMLIDIQHVIDKAMQEKHKLQLACSKKAFTVQSISEDIGIKRTILYRSKDMVSYIQGMDRLLNKENTDNNAETKRQLSLLMARDIDISEMKSTIDSLTLKNMELQKENQKFLHELLRLYQEGTKIKDEEILQIMMRRTNG